MARGRTLILALTLLLTLSPAALAQQEATTVTYLQMFFLGGTEDRSLAGLLMVWFLLALSAFSLGFTIMLFMQYSRAQLLPDATLHHLERLLNAKRYREAIDYAQTDPSYLGRLASAALNEAGNGYAAMEHAIEETGNLETTRILRPVEYLNVIGNIAPMIGLFGTVYGMIVAFQQLVAAGGSAEPAALAGGISTALVTTFWGLVVAIPSLAAYATIRNRIDALTSEGMLIVEQLIAPFKRRPTPAGAFTPTAAPRPQTDPDKEAPEPVDGKK